MHSLDTLFLRLALLNCYAVTAASVALTLYPRIQWQQDHHKRQVEVGQASWYGPRFNGKRAADGTLFDQNKLTAAHPSLPLGTYAKVTNLRNGAVVRVRITDRGPFVRGRVLDLSKAAAERLHMMHEGVTTVQIESPPRLPVD